MMSSQVLVRLDESLAEELDKMARSLGVSRAELVRIALRHFLRRRRGELKTKQIRGMVRSKLSLEELEELYQVGR